MICGRSNALKREAKLVKNTFILSIGTFLPKLASFVTLPILTGFLTKDEYGSYDLITVLVSLLLPAVTLQIQTAAFRFLVDERTNRESTTEIVSTIFAFIIPVSIVALIILWLFLPISNRLIKISVCSYFFIDIIVNATRQIARGLDKNFEYAVSSIISAFGKMIFALILVRTFNLGLFGATISLFVAAFCSWLYLTFRIGLLQFLSVKSISRNRLRTLLEYSWPMVPNSISMWVMRLSDRFVITLFLGVPTVAAYAVANKIPSILSLAQNSFSMAWQENASIVSKDEDAGAYYSSMFRTMFDLMIGSIGLLICFIPVIFKLFIHGNYEEAYIHIPILVIAEFFYIMSTMVGGIYIAFKKTKSVGLTTVFAASCNLIIDFVLINRIGLFAASLSTLISYIVLFVYRILDVQKIVAVAFDIKHMILTFGFIVIEAGLCMIRLPMLNVINFFVGSTFFYLLNAGLVVKVAKTAKRFLAHKIQKI